MDDKESSSYGGEAARRRKCGGGGGFTLLRLHAHFSFFVSTPYVVIKRKPAADYRDTRVILSTRPPSSSLHLLTCSRPREVIPREVANALPMFRAAPRTRTLHLDEIKKNLLHLQGAHPHFLSPLC